MRHTCPKIVALCCLLGALALPQLSAAQAVVSLVSRDADGNPGADDSGVRVSGIRSPARSSVADDGTVWFLSVASLDDDDSNNLVDFYRSDASVISPGFLHLSNLAFGLADASNSHVWMAERPNPFFIGSQAKVSFGLVGAQAAVSGSFGGLKSAELSGNGSRVVYEASGQLFFQTLLPAAEAATQITVAPDMQLGGNDESAVGGVSADGQVVVIATEASNLTAEPEADLNGVGDVLIYHADTETFRRLSVRRSGSQDDILPAGNPHVSADGRVVVFESADAQLADENDSDDGSNDLFIAVDGQLVERLAVGESIGLDARLSGDGRFVVYSARRDPSDANAPAQVFLYDRLDGSREVISRNAAGDDADASAQKPAISANGRYVSFSSKATNLIAGVPAGITQVYRVDRGAGFANRAPQLSGSVISALKNQVVAVTSNASDPDGDSLSFRLLGLPASGTLTDASGAALEVGTSYDAASLPWSFVGSASTEFSLVVNDGLVDSLPATIRLRVIEPGTPTFVLASPEDEIAFPSANQGIDVSADGARAVYTSSAGGSQLIRFADQLTQTSTVISEPLTNNNRSPVLSGDGRYAAWVTVLNNEFHLRRRNLDGVAVVDRVATGEQADLAVSGMLAIADDGASVLFAAGGDFQVWDLDAGTLTTIGSGIHPTISADGRWLAWHEGGEVIVRAFGSDDNAFVVSGSRPQLSAFGNRLLYRDAAGVWQLRDFINNSEEAIIAGPDEPARLSADGRFAIIFGDARLRRYDLSQSPVTASLLADENVLSHCATNADGSIVAFSTTVALAGTDQGASADVYLRDFGPSVQFPATGDDVGIAATEDVLFSGVYSGIADSGARDLQIELLVGPAAASVFAYEAPSPANPGGQVAYQGLLNAFGTDQFQIRFRSYGSAWQEATIPVSVAAAPDPPELLVTGVPFVLPEAGETSIGSRFLRVVDIDEPDGVTPALYQLELVAAGDGSLTDADGSDFTAATGLDKLPLQYAAPGMVSAEDGFQLLVRDADGLASQAVTVRVLTDLAGAASLSLNRGWTLISFAADPLPETLWQELRRGGRRVMDFSGRRWRRISDTASVVAGQGLAVYSPIATTVAVPLAATSTPVTIRNGWSLLGAGGSSPEALPAGAAVAYRIDARGRRLLTKELPPGKAVLVLVRP